MNASTKIQRQVEIFAGVKTDGCEAVVDTAAEEAVIGSRAIQRLREVLARHGLTPVEAPGTTVSCCGIGGNAKIVGIYDIPIGVAKCNSLLRATEIADEGSFETPFLLPISYIELVGGIVDTNKNQFILSNGRRTPMRRLPSGHRTISVTEFNGKWKLPDSLAQELKFEDPDPFHLGKMDKSTRLCQRPGVAVWLKKGDEFTYMGTLAGPRHDLVHPGEVLDEKVFPHLQRFRVTNAVFEDGTPFSCRDSWQFTQQRQLPLWSGDVFFELFGASSPTMSLPLQVSSSAMPSSTAALQVGESQSSFEAEVKSHCEVFDMTKNEKFSMPDGEHASSTTAALFDHQAQQPLRDHAVQDHPMASSCRSRGAPVAKAEDGSAESFRMLEENHFGSIPPDRDHREAGSSGLHHEPQLHQAGQAQGPSFAKLSDQEEDSWRWKDPQRHRSTSTSVKSMQDLAKRTSRLCSRRRPAETEGCQRSVLVDLPGLRKSLESLGVVSRRAGELWSRIFHGSQDHHGGDPDHVHSRLPDQAAASTLSTRSTIAEPAGRDNQQRGQPQGEGQGQIFRGKEDSRSYISIPRHLRHRRPRRTLPKWSPRRTSDPFQEEFAQCRIVPKPEARHR